MPYYSSGTVTDLLRSAVKTLDDASVPEELRKVAFEKSFDALAGNTAISTADENVSGRGPGDADAQRTTPSPVVTSTSIGKIAAAMGVDEEAAGHVFEVSGDELVLTVTRDQLGEGRVEAIREVALLVAAGRQAAGLDEDRTHTTKVRREAEQFNVVAKNTFQLEMGRLTPLVTVKKVSMGRELKITRQGNMEAGKIVTRITGGGA